MAGPFLVFELATSGERLKGPDSFALDVASVSQVVESPRTTPVPLAPPFVDGIINHHGRIVTVFDPAPLLGLQPQPEAAGAVVVLRRADGVANLGLRAARVREIVAQSLLEVVDVPTGSCVEWVARRNGRLIHVIGPAPFLEELSVRFGSLPDADRVRSRGASP